MESHDEDVERYVKKYGESRRRLIQDALRYVKQLESEIQLAEPMNLDEYIEDLMEHAQ